MKKVILFGDSITAGYLAYSKNSDADFYNDIIKRQLATLGNSYLEIINQGVPGEDTQDANVRFAHDVLAQNPDLLVVFFGANDASLSHDVSADEYVHNLLYYAQEVGVTKTILITPPYYNEASGDLSRKNSLLQEYRKNLLAMAKDHNIKTIDLYQAMINYPAPNEFLQADGLHFSKFGYELLGSLVAQAIDRSTKK